MSTEQSCNDWQDLLPAYHSGRLAAEDRTHLTAHLATCMNCQQALAHWRTITTALQATAQAVPPPPSDAALWAALGPRIRAEGGRAAVHDAPTRNGHHALTDAEFVPSATVTPRVPSAAPRQGSRGAAIVATVAVVALLVALFGALAAHRGSVTPATAPTATPVAIPAAFAIPNNLLATSIIGGHDFWVGGDDLLAHYNGQGGWTQITIPHGSIVKGIAMVTPTEGWAVGYGNGAAPLLLHDHGGSWQSVPLPGAANGLKAVRMASADDGWAWGNGTLLRYSGGQWVQQQTTPFAQSEIADLAAVAPGEAWVSSGHTLWHFHNGTWAAGGDLGTLSVAQLSMISPTEGWGVGTLSGAKQSPVTNDVWHYDGTAWSRVNPTLDPLSSGAYGIDQIFIHAHADGWVAVVANGAGTQTLDGHIVRYHAGQWSLATIPTGAWVHDVQTLGPDDAWAIASFVSGQNVTFAQLLHYHGGVWHTT